MSQQESHRTTDHDTIRQWVEARQGQPAIIKSAAQAGEGDLLRIRFDDSEDVLKPISWEEFFTQFEQSKLALLYQEQTQDGSVSRFCKFVSRD